MIWQEKEKKNVIDCLKKKKSIKTSLFNILIRFGI